jgi:hypothetical protein
MTKKKIKMGRPKAPKDKAKSNRIQARLTAEERDRINGAIAKSGLKESEWVRMTLLKAAS